MRINLPAIDLDGHALQRQPKAWAPNAFAGWRLEYRAVRRAHEIAGVRAKKLIVKPIERDAGVRTAIDVGKMIAFKVNQ